MILVVTTVKIESSSLNSKYLRAPFAEGFSPNNTSKILEFESDAQPLGAIGRPRCVCKRQKVTSRSTIGDRSPEGGHAPQESPYLATIGLASRSTALRIQVNRGPHVQKRNRNWVNVLAVYCESEAVCFHFFRRISGVVSEYHTSIVD